MSGNDVTGGRSDLGRWRAYRAPSEVRSQTQMSDRWEDWLLDKRAGGDPRVERALETYLTGIRDDVLRSADLRQGDTVVDLGTGTGLIAFGALEQVLPHGRVLLTDISLNLLNHCRERILTSPDHANCDFVQCEAQRLPFRDCCVDVVTARSVLMYVADRDAALADAYRVLRKQGRLSVFEPIFRPDEVLHSDRLFGYDLSTIPGVSRLVKESLMSVQDPATDPMFTFDERTLLRSVERAGFERVHLGLRVQIAPPLPQAWETFLCTSHNPNQPTFRDLIRSVLSPDEQRELEEVLRPAVEQGHGRLRSENVYLWATKV